jgi:Rps23 Pro-64 3,4-dihydroxylase Tpa1-like proline 4-hydroxylase
MMLSPKVPLNSAEGRRMTNLTQVREFLDLNRFGSHQRHTMPFTWSRVENVFASESLAKRLSCSFPGSCQSYERIGGSKNLRFRGLLLDSNLRQSPQSVDPIWFSLIDMLDCEEFRQVVSDHAGIDLAAADIDGGLWLYDKDAFFGPHTDRPTRLATLLFYLSPDWRAEWGGRLLILNSADPADVAAAITPSFNSCVMIVRSENSWHAVEPVTMPNVVRQVFSVRFFVRGAERNAKPRLTWRAHLGEAIQEADSLGLELLVYAAKGESRQEPPPFDDVDVTEMVYRRFVPVAVPVATVSDYIPDWPEPSALLIISSRGSLLSVLDATQPEKALRALASQ